MKKILHCLNWNLKDIEDNLELIRYQGFTTVLTSVLQGQKDEGTEWWKTYQPLHLEVKDNRIGTYTDLKELCRKVSARELYIGIGFDLSDGNFSRWIKKQLEDVDAVENEDYIVNVFKDVNPNGGKPITDYIITVDIAKEICMVIGVTPRCKDEVKTKE